MVYSKVNKRLKEIDQMKNYAAKNVGAYIANTAPAAQPKLKELRKVIKTTLPQAEESIKWGIPFYMYHGMVGGFSVFKNHISFGLGGPKLEEKDRQALTKKGYVTGTKIIQIKFNQPLPTSYIKKLLLTQAKLNEVKKATK